MKHNTTFAEVGKVFTMVAKIDTLAVQVEEARAKYRELGDKFDARFDELGYSFQNATEADHELFHQKLDASDLLDKKERAFYKAVKTFAEAIGTKENYTDLVEDEVNGFIRSKYYFKSLRIANDCKFLAKKFASRIEY